MRGTRCNRKGFLASVKIGSPSQQPRIAGRIRTLPAKILSYRAPTDMSTRKLTVALFVLALMVFGPSAGRLTLAAEQTQAATEALPPNALKDSASLYLREAAAGPIRWQPWNEATFALARKLKRPLLIDIGAVWCHWCHVMDQTTYADPKVVAMVNDDFVPVKVDTDERPDIDGYYQVAAQNFSAGGWPLTCFATPDGAPLLIAGYLPPTAEEHRGMLWVLSAVSEAYNKDPKFDKLAHEIAAKVGEAEVAVGSKPSSFDELRGGILNGTRLAFEAEAQGQGESASFYDFPAVQAILAHGFFGHPEFAGTAVARLKTIAAGGVYDQLGGGFHRYSVDARWRVPHFEKLAYDQAMALKTYAQAYEVTHDNDFARVAKSIVAYVDGTMLDAKSHTFYSHQDADSFAGDDGSYYTWTEEEVRHLLKGTDLKVALMHFGFTDDPGRAPDGRVVLRAAMSANGIAHQLKISDAEASAAIERASKAMLAARDKRHAPQVDTSVLIDRNALMASAYITAAEAFGDQQLKRIALDNLDYLYANARANNGSFYHVLDRGQAGVPGLAADQVYMMNALLDAYQASGDRKYLDRASSLGALLFEGFRDPATGMLKSRAPATPGTVLTQAAPMMQVFYDDPTPAIQAVAADAFRTLAALTSDPGDAAKAEEMLRPATTRIGSFGGPNNGALGLALEQQANGETVVAIAGEDHDSRTAELLRGALATYRPGKVVILLGSSDKHAQLPDAMKAMYEAAAHHDAPLAFVCAGTACATPSGSADALAKTIRDFAVNRGNAGNLATR
jgi:uncharacterized protein YyaL (SSP411 family)